MIRLLRAVVLGLLLAAPILAALGLVLAEVFYGEMGRLP